MSEGTDRRSRDQRARTERARAERVESVLPTLASLAAEVDAKGEFHVPHVKTLSEAGLFGLIVTRGQCTDATCCNPPIYVRASGSSRVRSSR